MGNLYQNFQNMMDYYFYSGSALENLIIPFLIVVVMIILLRLVLGFCFQIDKRVKTVKNLSKSFDEVAKQLSEQNQLLRDSIELNKKISADLEKVRDDNIVIADLLKSDIYSSKTVITQDNETNTTTIEN